MQEKYYFAQHYLGTKKEMREATPTIIGDFCRYCLICFFAFFSLGIIFGFINGFSWAAVLFNPLIYSIGVSLIIIVVKYDYAELLDFCGLSKDPELKPAIKYSREIQEIGMLMSLADYQQALQKVDLLLKKEPKLPTAYNLRGEILLSGFNKRKEARQCFHAAQKYAKPGDEDYEIAASLQAASFDS
jgi:tetratricopeptide (TPR) repeat protein